jgi:phospholipid transport system transporter-binding protein
MAPKINVRIKDNVLTLSGVLDHQSILDANEQGQLWLRTSTAQDCYLDLGLVTYSNSAGIALILGWLRTAHQFQKSLRIISLPDNILALAQVSGLDELLKQQSNDRRARSM